jgi:hypothetical protein
MVMTPTRSGAVLLAALVVVGGLLWLGWAGQERVRDDVVVANRGDAPRTHSGTQPPLTRQEEDQATDAGVELPEGAAGGASSRVPKQVPETWTLRVQVLRTPASGTAACAFVTDDGVVVSRWRAEPGIEHFVKAAGSGRVIVDAAEDGIWVGDTVARGFAGVMRIDARRSPNNEAFIEGIVVDPTSSEPVSGVDVVATMLLDSQTADETPVQWTPRRVKTGDAGSFRVPCLPHGTVRLVATPGDSLRRGPVELTVDANARGVRLVLAPVCRVGFVLENASTKAAAKGPQLEILQVEGEISRRVFYCEYSSWQSSQEPYEAAHVPARPGEMTRYRVRLAGFDDQDVEVFAEPGELTVSVRVLLSPAPHDIIPVTFDISSEDGRAITRVSLIRSADGTRTARSYSLPNNALTLHLPAGRHELEFVALDLPEPTYVLPRTLALTLVAGSGQTRYPVVFRLGGIVRVIGPNDLVAGEWAWPLGEGTQERMIVISKRVAEGRAHRVGPLPPGKWELDFIENGLRRVIEVQVVAGATVDVNVGVESGGSR